MFLAVCKIHNYVNYEWNIKIFLRPKVDAFVALSW